MIEFYITERIGIIKLVSEKNILGISEIESLIKHIDAAKSNSSVKSLLLLGVDRYFCTGIDLAQNSSEVLRLFDCMLLKLFSFNKPLIAGIDGHSIGGGLLMQLCCDYVVKSDRSNIKLGFPELKLGLTLDSIMLTIIKYRTNLNLNQILKTLTNGLFFEDKFLLDFGFVDEIVSSNKIFDFCLEKCRNYMQLDVSSFSTTKELLRHDSLLYMNKEFRNNCYMKINMLLKN